MGRQRILSQKRPAAGGEAREWASFHFNLGLWKERVKDKRRIRNEEGN